MTYQVIRLGTDFNTSVQELFRDYIQDNWSLTGELDGTNRGKMMFTNGWFQKQPQYIVSVRHDIDKMPRRRTLGNKPIKKFDDVIQVHCWETTQTDNDEPARLDQMCREVQRIINSDELGLSSSGIMMMNCGSAQILPMEDSQAAIFHAYQRIEFTYLKRNI